MNRPDSALADHVNLPELTLRGIILGALITVVFTASNVYLGLRVGLTFSSAIPAAVISMAVLRMFSGSNILENNMVQTQASAAGTLSSVIFILPALVMMGYWHGFEFWQTLLVCAAGGMLGVMFTIPLRRVMVAESNLPYPEGVAAAEILRVGDRAAKANAAAAADAANPANHARAAAPPAATGLADIATGGVVAAVVSLATGGLRILADGASKWVEAGSTVFRLPMGFSLALLGAGYLIGVVAGLAMLLGLVLSWGVLVPILTAMQTVPAGQTLVDVASAQWSSQVRFVGAGVIGVGAVWTLATLFMPMVRGMRASLGGLRRASADVLGDAVRAPRTERDLPGAWIAGLTLLMVAVLVAVFGTFMADAPVTTDARWSLIGFAVLFAVVFGFLVAAACGYMAGLVGSSTSPISGVGIVAIVLISLLILGLGEATGLLATAGGERLAIALAIFTTSAIIAVAAISNDNLQDLKTGWLLGATPWRQQVALLIGCCVGAVVIAPILNVLYQAYGFTGAMPRPGMDDGQALSAPQATLMLAIAQGIFTHELNWAMIQLGVAIGAALIAADQILKRCCAVARIPVLAVGIGIYLPPTISAPLVVGALLGWVVERRLRHRHAAQAANPVEHAAALQASSRRGVLIASGLIVGESLVGVAMAAVIGITGRNAPLAVVGADFEPTAEILGLAVFAMVAVLFARRILAAR